MACGPTLPATLTAPAAQMVGADACWWPQPWNWLARMRKLVVAPRAFSKPWRPGWPMHFPVRRRRASWPTALSLQVPPELWSVSLRGCAWSQNGATRITSQATVDALLDRLIKSANPWTLPYGAPISRLIGLEGKMPCLPSRSSARWQFPCSGVTSSWLSRWALRSFRPLFLALRFLAIALLLVPFVKRPTRQQLGPIAAISIFLGGLNFGLF